MPGRIGLVPGDAYVQRRDMACVVRLTSRFLLLPMKSNEPKKLTVKIDVLGDGGKKVVPGPKSRVNINYGCSVLLGVLFWRSDGLNSYRC